jgi:hypothetical protein
MFEIGNAVKFGIRFDGHGRLKGGIARKAGTVTNVTDTIITVSSEGKELDFRLLKGGWVLTTERDDPKGRLYLTKV